MLLMMGVTLYTSRVVLNALGVEDYGIYNVVGGVVAMFTIISGSLRSTITRFLNFELGRSEQTRLNNVFNTSILIQIALSVIIFILVESIGLWFLNNKMVIATERLVAARWVLQFSLLTLVINLISTPYNAAIIARERMSAFAYISIVEVIGKLIVAYFISISPIDRLIFYAAGMCIISVLVLLCYGTYCKHHFEECRKFKLRFHRETIKDIFKFASWNFFGAAATIIRDQGGNVLLNLYGGPIVNAARAISTQVQNGVLQFSTNFLLATNPQVTKSYANNDKVYMMNLVFQSSRFAFYLMFVLSLPILINVEFILNLWLGTVPDYTITFAQLAIILALVDLMSRPLDNANNATGNIKSYRLITSSVQLLNIPFSYFLLHIGFQFSILYWVAIVLSIINLIIRIFLLHRIGLLNYFGFLKDVVLNVILISFISTIFPLFLSKYTGATFWDFVFLSAVCIINSVIAIYFAGLKNEEKRYIKNKIPLLNKNK